MPAYTLIENVPTGGETRQDTGQTNNVARTVLVWHRDLNQTLLLAISTTTKSLVRGIMGYD